MTLTYHGLIALPSGCNGGIYRLRIYQQDSRNPVVILTEVPGNPGYSITNAMDALVAYCAEQCGVPIDFLYIFGEPGTQLRQDSSRNPTKATLVTGFRLRLTVAHPLESPGSPNMYIPSFIIVLGKLFSIMAENGLSVHPDPSSRFQREHSTVSNGVCSGTKAGYQSMRKSPMAMICPP